MKKVFGFLMAFLVICLIFKNEKQNQNKEIQFLQNQPEHEIVIEDTAPHDDHLHEEELLENGPMEKNYQNKKSINFTLKTLKGNELTLNERKGKKVFLNFWTTWCPPCQQEMPQINSFYKTYGKAYNVEVVAVNITDQDSGIDVIKEFADYYQLTFPIVLDEKGEVSEKYEVITIPTSFIIDENGNIMKEIIGPVTEKYLADYFKKHFKHY